MSARVFAPNRVLFRVLLIGTLAVTAAGISAVAQPGGPGGGAGGGIPPEVRAKIEAAQAQTVAASLSLDAEKSAKLAEAYSAARKAVAENRPAGGGRGDFEAMRKVQEEQQAKQAEALGHTLAYVKASAKARTDSAGAGDMEAIRASMTATKKTLDEAIAPLLSDAQKAEWTEKTSRAPRGGSGDERRRRGDGDAPAPGAPN